MHDLSKNHEWKSRIFNKTENAQFILEICTKLGQLELKNYTHRNLQAKIMARFVYIGYIHHKSISPEIFESLTEKISDGEFS